MLTPAFPSDLGLSDIAYSVLSKIVINEKVEDIDASPEDIMSAINELITKELISIDDTKSGHLSNRDIGTLSNSSLNNSTQPTAKGLLLLNSLAKAGDHVVYLHKAIDPDGQINIYPVICYLLEDIYQESILAKIGFTSAEISADGDIECVDITRATVSINLLMRVNDYCSSPIRFHFDEAKYHREHDLGLIEGHNP